jgi:hypothetical protein
MAADSLTAPVSPEIWGKEKIVLILQIVRKMLVSPPMLTLTVQNQQTPLWSHTAFPEPIEKNRMFPVCGLDHLGLVLK